MDKINILILLVFICGSAFAYDNSELGPALSKKYGNCFTLEDGEINTWTCEASWPSDSKIAKAVEEYETALAEENAKKAADKSALKTKLGITDSDLAVLKEALK